MLKPYRINEFPGLRLDVDANELGPAGATGLLNVDLDDRGRLRCRGGFSRAKAVTMTTPQGLAVRDTVTAKQFLVGYTAGGTSTYDAYTAAGTLVATTTVSGSGAMNAAAMTVSGIDVVYLANGNGNDTIRKWNGSAFSQPAGMPKAVMLAVTPTTQRLVAAVVGTDVHRVRFSGPGAPETFGADDYVDLPFGGGLLSGAETWQNLLFVFKTSRRFFVFYGESIDGDGEPVFNYRAVDGFGCLGAAAGDEGVYFHDGRTVWLTTGGVPTRVSEAIEPYLRGEASINGETVDLAETLNTRVGYSLGRLYVSVLITTGERRTLVFDPRLQTWTLYSVGVVYPVTLPSAFGEEPRTLWLSPAGVERFDGSATDAGTAIDWTYTSGFYDLGAPEEKKIRYTDLYGSGTVNVELLTRGGRSGDIADPGGSLTLATAPDVARARRARSARARLFAHTLSGQGPAVVHTTEHWFIPPARTP